MGHQSNDDRRPAGHASGLLRGRATGNAPPSRSPTRRLVALALTSGAVAVGGGNAAADDDVGTLDGFGDGYWMAALNVPLTAWPESVTWATLLALT